MPRDSGSGSGQHAAARSVVNVNQRISIQDAAEVLGVSTRTVRRYIADGSLPAERVHGRLLRVRVTDVEALCQPVRTVQARDDR